MGSEGYIGIQNAHRLDFAVHCMDIYFFDEFNREILSWLINNTDENIAWICTCWLEVLYEIWTEQQSPGDE